MGFSSGELAAAYASGAITSAEAIIGAYYRGLVTKQQTCSGGMAAVGLGQRDVTPYLTKDVEIACENSPETTTLAGDEIAISALLDKIRAAHPDILAARLRIELPYHSCELVRHPPHQTSAN